VEPDVSRPRRARVGAIVTAVLLMLVTIAVCGALGMWQWSRSHQQAVTVVEDPVVPLADVIAPASPPGAAIGRQVSVSGTWADADAAIVSGREVDGTPAEFLVRPLIVDADLTGTGEPATLAVIVGWREAGDLVGPDPETGTVTFDGYVRSAEQSMPGATVPDGEVDGAFFTSAASVAELAQVWPGPFYSATYDGSPSWEPLPPVPNETSLNIQSLAYSFEWWIFGAFAVFIGVRWIRDNGFTSAGDDTRKDDA
jgi:cytochrome oxidase assembly protein ShyY1